MPDKEISFFAALLEQYGIVNVAFSVMLVIIALSIPTILSWLKDGLKRKDDKKLLIAINELSGEIKMLTRQYGESVSLSMVETVMENFLKHHMWSLFDFVREIIEKNDIKNEKGSIESKIQMQVFLTFKAIDNDLTKFKYKIKSLNEFVDRCEWETQINNTIMSMVYEEKITASKRISNVRTYLKTEFGNVHFLVMQQINKY